jgi:CRP-like cAMP-binding protein
MPSSDRFIPAPLAVRTLNINDVCPAGSQGSSPPMPDGEIRTFAAGEIVFSEYSAPGDVLIFREGVAELIARDPHGEILAMREVEPGEIFGVTESIARAPFRVSLRAVTDCRIEYFEIKEFIQLLKERDDLLFNLLQRLATGLQECLNSFKICGPTDV